jgi:broad specificity phosphatase PhoE
MRHALAAILGLLLSAVPAAAQGTVFVVRHAERADAAAGGATMMAADPELSTEGTARAESLARLLTDAAITAIYTTEFKRTRQTAAPLARALKLEPVTIPSKDLASLIERLKTAKGDVLVVGHSNTVPEIVKALGVGEPVTVAEHEFDRLFIIVGGVPPTLVKLRYR